jgi:hypothetical protein
VAASDGVVVAWSEIGVLIAHISIRIPVDVKNVFPCGSKELCRALPKDVIARVKY